MKRILMVIFLGIVLAFTNTATAQSPCETVSAVAFARNPQTGSNNYFGVRISISETFTQNITVSGYIYEEGSYNTNNPFSLTITAGNTSAETADNFFATGPTGIAVLSVTNVTPCPAVNFLEDFSSEYVKKHVAVVDFYVRSISTSNFVREIYFKNYGTTALPSVVGYNDDLFFDDGTHNDQTSGDGIYTSTDSYAHTSTVTYTSGASISVQQDYAIIDNTFEHETSFNSFLSTYSVPTGGGSFALAHKNRIVVGDVISSNAFTDGTTQNGPKVQLSNAIYEVRLPHNIEHFSLGSHIDHLEEGGGNKESKLYKFKASLKCDVASCNCSTCHCRACNYRWGQSLNWCFTMSNCSIEIGWN